MEELYITQELSEVDKLEFYMYQLTDNGKVIPGSIVFCVAEVRDNFVTSYQYRKNDETYKKLTIKVHTGYYRLLEEFTTGKNLGANYLRILYGELNVV